MTNEVHYLLLMSLSGIACMAIPHSNAEVNVKQTLHESNVLDKKGGNTAEKKVDARMTPFWKDIKNHPFLWVTSAILGFVNSFLTGLFTPVLVYENGSKDMPLKKNFYQMIVPIVVLLIFSAIYVLVSLIAAMWRSRWIDKSKEGAEPTFPRFGTRMWRAIRFIFSHSILPCVASFYLIDLLGFLGKNDNNKVIVTQTGLIPFYGICIIPPLVTCITGLVYGYWRRSQQEDKKTSIEKKA